MPCVSSSTLNSSPGRTGDSYYVNFDFTRKYNGKRLTGYKGKFNGNGRHQGDFAIVKIPKIRHESEKWCDLEISKNRKANELLKSFLSYLRQDRNDLIEFTDSWKALMDEVSCLSKGIRHRDWVIIEERIGKECHQFINYLGQSDFGGCEILEAFLHWSYAVTNGGLVIANFDGIQDESGAFKLKTPTIHSVNECYGESDFGELGVNKVLKNHHCNPICSKWKLPTRTWVEETMMKCVQIVPTAPYIHQYPPYFQYDNDYIEGPPPYEECVMLPT